MSDDPEEYPAMFGGEPDDDVLNRVVGYVHRAMRQPERIECTRAEFAERMGVWPDPDTIGVCVVAPDGRTIVTEFVFTDKAYPPEKFLTRTALTEIAELERLLKLNTSDTTPDSTGDSSHPL